MSVLQGPAPVPVKHHVTANVLCLVGGMAPVADVDQSVDWSPACHSCGLVQTCKNRPVCTAQLKMSPVTQRARHTAQALTPNRTLFMKRV